MPVRISRARDVIEVKVGGEVYVCKYISQKKLNELYAEYGEVSPDGDYTFPPKRFITFAYDLASVIVKGWRSVTDEDTGQEVKFSLMAIHNMNEKTVVDMATRYLDIRTNAEVQRDEEIKN